MALSYYSVTSGTDHPSPWAFWEPVEVRTFSPTEARQMDVLKAMDEPVGPPDLMYSLSKHHGRPKGRKYTKQDARAFQKRVEKRRAKKARK